MTNVRYNPDIDKLQIYFDGEWKDYGKVIGFVTHFLYNEGDTCDDLTGGWSNKGYPSWSGYTFTAGKLNNTSMTISGVGSSKGQVLGTQEPIDLTSYSTLKVEVLQANKTSTYCCSVDIGANKENGTSYNIVNTGYQIFTVDITNLTGEFYISLRSANESTRTVTVSKIWLEL